MIKIFDLPIPRQINKNTIKRKCFDSFHEDILETSINLAKDCFEESCYYLCARLAIEINDNNIPIATCSLKK